jgi:AP-1 complex subunit sigma 1/2
MNDMGSDYPKAAACGWNFIVLMSRQGKIRLSEFFSSYTEGEKRRILRDIAADVLPRQPKMCNIIEKGEYKFVYRRYASLYFVAGIPPQMNELIVLEQIHLFVEALDGYFNSGKLGLLTQTVCNFF